MRGNHIRELYNYRQLSGQSPGGLQVAVQKFHPGLFLVAPRTPGDAGHPLYRLFKPDESPGGALPAFSPPRYHHVELLCQGHHYGLTAIVGKPSLVQKVYFPRDILVISGCITALLQSLFESLIFIAFMIALWIPISVNIFYLAYILSIYFITDTRGGICPRCAERLLPGHPVYLGGRSAGRVFYYADPLPAQIFSRTLQEILG